MGSLEVMMRILVCFFSLRKEERVLIGFLIMADLDTEPPSFADRAVAGGCKTLFYQLYQSVSILPHDRELKGTYMR